MKKISASPGREVWRSKSRGGGQTIEKSFCACSVAPFMLAVQGEFARVCNNELKRDAIWTKSLAVGSGAFLEQIEPGDVSRRQIKAVQAAEKVWALPEPSAPLPFPSSCVPIEPLAAG